MSDVTCPNCGHHFRVGYDPAWAASMRQRRQALGLTLQQVSDRVGYTTVHISEVERCTRGKPADGVRLERWYDLLGVPAEERI